MEEKDGTRLPLLITQTDYSAVYRDIEQLIYRSVLFLSLDLAHIHMKILDEIFFTRLLNSFLKVH